jgi:glycosyltransferase involved in cell wall biosynthesis
MRLIGNGRASVNWFGYNWRRVDGYGRYSAYMVQALRRAGVSVTPHFVGAADAPAWLCNEWGVAWDRPTISCMPPFYLRRLPQGSGPHWLLSMTEGSELPQGWAKAIAWAGIDHVIVPCEHNADVFRRGGVTCPVSVIHGGTDPDEFPRLPQRTTARPYTFLCLADRGKRKGWGEVYQAFYAAFGGKTTGDLDVRLLVKSHPDDEMVRFILRAPDLDKRLVFVNEDYDDMADLYAQADCVAMPSRSEGWGMPHREAAMMGVPVITQAYSGLDDGHTDEWALVVEGGRMERVEGDSNIAGLWRTCDRYELARIMRRCYDEPAWAAAKGQQAAQWLRANQTWDHAAANLLQLLQREGVLSEMEYA